MKKFLSLAVIMTMANMFVACNSDRYHIKGEAPTMNGDTLFLINDMNAEKPSDTLIVKDGKFETEGTTDSTRFCMLYSQKSGEVIQQFFIEPGTIELTLAENPQESKVSGTSNNNKWQKMNDECSPIGMQIMKIASKLNRGNISYEEGQLEMRKVMNLQEEFKKIVKTYAEKNVDNVFGFFLLTDYDNTEMKPQEQWLIDSGTRLSLIEKMPANMQQHPAIKRIIERINKLKAMSEGQIIPDFTMDGIDGKPVNALEEIGKNEITIIDFWASWCGPCRAEMPQMVKMYNEYRDKGLGILGISLDSKHNDWKEATKNLGVKWPQMSDLRGWDNAAARMFDVRSIPQTIVVDKNGRILKKGLRGEELETFIANLMK